MNWKSAVLCGMTATLCLPALATAEDLWVTPIARGKGFDYLVVVDLTAKEAAEKTKTPPRRIRCTTSLPIYIEEMAESAEKIKGDLYMRVRVTVVPDKFDPGERVTDLKILMVCLLPEASKAHLAELKKWSDFPVPLPEEPEGPSPFGNDRNDPFGSSPKAPAAP